MQFLGNEIPNINIEKAQAVILPVPFDASVCYKPGARFAPERILSASRALELYDEELDSEPFKYGIYTLEPIDVPIDPFTLSKEVEKVVKDIVKLKKLPVLIGGDHSISIGAIRAISDIQKEKGKNFTVLQFDAHTDMRDEYQGSKYSHACVMRRAFDFGASIIQVGIRSLSHEEKIFLDKNGIKPIWAREIYNNYQVAKSQILESIREPLYITIDLDCLDPSIMPDVGTPEPGGLNWYQLIDILKAVCLKTQILGIDVVELCPNTVASSTEYLAARLIYKILGYIFLSRNSNN